MASMRQRKADAQQSPSSRGSLSMRSAGDENMTQIVIEDENNSDNNLDDFDSYYRPTPQRFIPDKQYKDFMLGRAVQQKDTSMCPDGKTCAGRCVGFSWVATFFLFWVYFLINNQPIFIKGIQPKGAFAVEGVTFKVSTAEQILPAAGNAWYAAIAYLFTIFLCVAYRNHLFFHLSARIRRHRRSHYDDIPDANSNDMLPTFHQEAYATRRNQGVW
eukprot:CAMPEP_0119004434 /NCGR_PEP_ID=MMETSP1176-20130426/1137_1 /TAXON_ID=265551 /ORGANISM="Synedropsis recta cf, Strain CCMP1620" /LENGTH=215 /DNA_ID=CAMNT_0006956133 /DNA_START=17 /DNA_END=661 /DNA_ORIENTATION=+